MTKKYIFLSWIAIISLVSLIFVFSGDSYAAESGDAAFKRAVSSYQEGKMDSAASAFDAAGAAYAKEKNRLKSGQSYFNGGLCLVSIGQKEAARRSFEEAAEQYKAAKNASGECRALFYAAQLYLDEMAWDKAREYYERGLKLKLVGKDATLRGVAQEGLGRVKIETGLMNEAEKHFKDAEASFKNSPPDRQRVRLEQAHIIGRVRGDEAEALRVYDSVIADATKLAKAAKAGDAENIALYLAMADKGQFLLSTGAFGQAKDAIGEAVEKGEDIVSKYPDRAAAVDVDNLKKDYALTLTYLGEFGEAERELQQLLTVAASDKDVALNMAVNDVYGTLEAMRGKYAVALDHFKTFYSLAVDAGNPTSVAQSLLKLGELYEKIGMWSEAAANYREALSKGLEAQKMDVVLMAMLDIYHCDLRNELGMVGKVDYRTAQGLPWRAALTARQLKKKKSPQERDSVRDSGFDRAWKTVDSLRADRPIPSIDGFRTIREVALRNAPELRNYYQEVAASLSIGDAALRRGEKRAELAGKASEALRELSARKGEAKDEDYVKTAFAAAAKLLRSLAGGDSLTLPESGLPIQQMSGIVLDSDAPEPENDQQQPAKSGIETDAQAIAEMVKRLSPNAEETRAIQKALLDAEALPIALKTRLRKTLFSDAAKQLAGEGKEEREKLEEILLRVLNSTHRSLKKAGQRQLASEAKELAPKTSAYMLAAIDAGDEMLKYLNAWSNMRRRVLVMKELEISPALDKDWVKFFSNFGDAVGKAAKTFASEFDLTLEDPETTAKRAERLRAVAENLALMDVTDEAVNIGAILASKDNISYDDRLSMLELQGRIRLALSKWDAAKASAGELLSLLGSKDGEDVETKPDTQWRAYAIMALAAEKTGDYAEAARQYDKAIAKLELVSPVEGTTSQSAFDRAEMYGGAIRSGFALWEKDKDAKKAARLWELIEGMKNRRWKELLATTGGEFLNALPPADREKVREIEMRLVALDGAYRRASSSGQRDEMTRANNEMKRLREERVELTRGRTVDLDEVLGVDSVRAKLPDDWGLVNYYISPKLSFAILLTRSDEAAVVPLDLDYDSLFGYSYWRRLVDGGEDKNEYDKQRLDATACGLSPEDVGEALFQPIASACGDIRKILVIPHDILYVLPLEALQKKGDDGKARYLVEDWTFAELPSAYLLTREGEARAPEDRSLLLMANPSYAPLLQKPREWRPSLSLALNEDPDFEKMLKERLGVDLKAALSGADKERIGKIMGDIESLWSGDVLGETKKRSELAYNVKNDFGKFIKPLDGSQSEADDLRKLWNGKSSSAPLVLLATHASESDFWESDPGKYRYVHIACHGYDRTAIPDLQPGLVLSPIRDNGNDSFLQMGELAMVRWNADLITLSACETGLGDLYVGDGMFGLSTVLLAGGAKGTILTRWRAVDESAARFMPKFYEGILDGREPVDALRDAQLALLSGEFKAPRHWAIFKYVGIPW
ncbi:MAG: CHAT domain-containing protein [Synergistaceae bacterium]|jgi:CHAT domain-containing protein/tetratricopeptide (TPR) repeat protein|nr:CHAT domain-containing protein [Synergistaceae bacterium]